MCVNSLYNCLCTYLQSVQQYDCNWSQTGLNFRQCVYSLYIKKKKKSETKLTAAILKEDKNMQKVRNECLFLIKQDKTVRKFSRNFLFVKQINILTLHFNGRRMFKMKIVFFVCAKIQPVYLFTSSTTQLLQMVTFLSWF